MAPGSGTARPTASARRGSGMDARGRTARGWTAGCTAGARGLIRLGRRAVRRLSGAAVRAAVVPPFALLLALPWATRAGAEEPIQIKVIGGLDRVGQYVRLEEPFWRDRVPALTGGRVRAEIHPFDRSGLRGQEMLQLMRLGVVPFGTANLALVSTDEPELDAMDLPGLNPDMAALRRNVGLYRPHLQAVLRDRYGVELLGIYAYPAQVVHCAKPFARLRDLAGRRVRTSSVGQSEMMAALGAVPVITPFSEVVGAVRGGAVECAITGALNGAEIGLSEITSHVHAMAISWGLSFFGANLAAWDALPGEVRDALRRGIAELERGIWDASERETAEGLACATGSAACTRGRRGKMRLVPATPEDDAQRSRLLVEAVLPAWVQRCGAECARAWNRTLAPTLGVGAGPD